MEKEFKILLLLCIVLIVPVLCNAEIITLTNSSPNFTVTADSDDNIYGTTSSNAITLESGGQAKLLNFQGSNTVIIQSDSSLFTVYRSGATVTFQGSDGTVLTIPATVSIQTISFNGRIFTLTIDSNQVMLDDQVVGLSSAPVSSSVIPNAVTLISPSGTVSTATPTYTWNATSNATHYHLFPGNAAGPVLYSADDAGCGDGMGTCSVTTDIALSNDDYTWYVQPENSSGAGPLSSDMNFTVAVLEDSWQQVSKLKADDGSHEDYFGNSVSISGDYAIVGASHNDYYNDYYSNDNFGSAYIYKGDGNNWQQVVKLTADDGAYEGYFGKSVSISGDYAIVGAYGDDDNGNYSGSAYIFKRSGNTWQQDVKLLPDDGASYDQFGTSVSISGDYAIVGAEGDDDNGSYSGSAYIFSQEGDTWKQVAKLRADDGNSDDSFGKSVSISGDYAIVGAYRAFSGVFENGSAYIFKQNNGIWQQVAVLNSTGCTRKGSFGESVSISGDYAVVGMKYDDTNGRGAGSAYIFKRESETWQKVAKLSPDDNQHGDNFGSSVSISGDYVIVGVKGDDDNGSESGSAYIYKRDGNTWEQVKKLLPNDGASEDYFGESVSISGNRAIVGAFEDDDNGTDSGSAYIFGL